MSVEIATRRAQLASLGAEVEKERQRVGVLEEEARQLEEAACAGRGRAEEREQDLLSRLDVAQKDSRRLEMAQKVLHLLGLLVQKCKTLTQKPHLAAYGDRGAGCGRGGGACEHAQAA